MLVGCEKQDDLFDKKREFLLDQFLENNPFSFSRSGSCPELITKQKINHMLVLSQKKHNTLDLLNDNNSTGVGKDDSMSKQSEKQDRQDSSGQILSVDLRKKKPNKSSFNNNSTNNLSKIESNQIRNSNASTSSYGKNYILKSEVCKSCATNSYYYYGNRYSEENPWVN